MTAEEDLDSDSRFSSRHHIAEIYGRSSIYFLGSLAFLTPASRARLGAKKGKLSNKPPPKAAPTILPPSPAFFGASFLVTTESPTSRS